MWCRAAVAHWAHDPKVVGSNPTAAIKEQFWAISSMAERLFYTQDVNGSIPLLLMGR